MAGLDGLKVLDISSGIAGPFCARLLADGGAEVIKIEDPAGGDPARAEAAEDKGSECEGARTSPLFVFLNQNKRGISLDLTSPSGRELFKRLVAISDVVVESSKPGTLAQLGLGYSELAALNPGIILASITDFGQNGPYQDYAADHLSICALGGWAYTFGMADREPLQVGFPVMYYMAGIYGAIGVLAALRGRRQDGKGQHVDVSAQEACLNMLSYPQMLAPFNCPPLKRDFTTTLQTFYIPAKDGLVALNHLSVSQWENTCAMIGLPHLAEDPTLLYDMNKKRAIVPEFMAAACAWAQDKTQAEAFYAAQELQIPAGIPYTPKELLASDQLQSRDFLVRTQQPGLGEFIQPRKPFHSSSRCTDLPSAPVPAPSLGQDNRQVLERVGVSSKDLRALRSARVI